ncbi:MAG: hypothetical protein Q7V62_01195, partial [Actinomycetota bacterium]|nr:hypothetical protein [Actinomycetota bacterium]
MRRTLAPLVLVVALLAAACSDDSGTGSDTTTPSDTTPESTTDVGPTTTAPEDAILEVALRCDPLDERSCLLPWPNDAFTVPDETTATGRRLDLHPESTPMNAQGVHIDVTDQNRADGFSPGSAIVALVPGLNMEVTGIAPSTDIGASLEADAPIVLLDTTSGERVPYWAELDAPAPVGDQLLMIHPAVSLPEGHRIVVGLRDLKDESGDIIERSTAFQAALDNAPEPLERARAFRELIGALVDDGVDAESLYLAWDFTVASAESLSGRVLHMRDQAYDELGDAAPLFTVTSSTESDGVRVVTGTFEVPNFLTGDGSVGNRFDLGPDGLPVRNADTPAYVAAFHCVVPVASTAPAPGIVYGHGLLGNRFEVEALSFAAQIGLAVPCATD